MITKSFPKSKNLENGRFNDIAFIKTNMMICVVLCHATAFFTGNWFSVYTPVYSAGYLASFSDFLGFFHIQSFTMASGFLFYYLILKKGRYDNPKKDIKKRAQRLLVPYLFTSVLWAIPIGAMFFNYSWGDIINKYVLMTGPAQLWFLIIQELLDYIIHQRLLGMSEFHRFLDMFHLHLQILANILMFCH